MHFYAWSVGLKTGMYYLRTRQKADAIQFTVDQVALKEARATSALVPTEASKGFAFPTSGSGAASTSAAAAAGAPLGGSPSMPGPRTVAVICASESPSEAESGASSRDGSPVMFATPIARRAALGAGKAEGGGGGGGDGSAPAGASPAEAAPMTPEQREAFLEAKARAAAEARKAARAAFEAQEDAAKAGECLNCGS